MKEQNRKKRIIVLFVLMVFIIIVLTSSIKAHRTLVVCRTIEHGEKQEALELIDSISNPNTTTGLFGKMLAYIEADSYFTPLISACKTGDKDLITALLEKGADPNRSLSPADYPLECFVERSYEPNSPVLREMIEAGADPNLYRYHSALSQIATYASRIKGKTTILSEELEDICYLLEHGGDIRCTDHGTNIIHFAALMADESLLIELLNNKENRIYIDDQSYDGRTPLMWAVSGGYIDNVKILLKYGADRELKDNEGKTARDYAIESENKEIIELLS